VLAEVHDEVAGPLCGPGPVGLSGHAQACRYRSPTSSMNRT
jgi:hypothetical protein